jgi:1-acyl-sn-glycerol-3-phosphate acyltransferase
MFGTVLGYLRFALSAVWTFVATLALIPAVFISPLRGVRLIGRAWAWAILKTCNVTIEAHGLENVDPKQGYLVLVNHTSTFDAVAVYHVLPMAFRVLAKRELTYIPIFGQVLWLGVAIIVDRGDRKNAIKSVDRARASIEKGESILVFPEGSRTPEGELGSFKKGAFYLATEAMVPVLTVGIKGAGPCLRRGSACARPGKITVRIGAAIESSGYPATSEGRSALMSEVETDLRKLMA